MTKHKIEIEYLGRRKNTKLDEDELMNIRQQFCDILNIMTFGSLEDLEDESVVPIAFSLKYTIIALAEKLHSMGSDTFLLGVDEEGFFFPTEETIKAKKLKDPDKEFFSINFSKEIKSGYHDVHTIRIDKAITKAIIPLTESRRKELERKKRYYLRHRQNLLDNQNKYDKEHRVQIHFKNKNYYLLKKQGASRTYNYAPYLASADENDVSYHEITEHEKEIQENE
jgi:hypothetical protein